MAGLCLLPIDSAGLRLAGGPKMPTSAIEPLKEKRALAVSCVIRL